MMQVPHPVVHEGVLIAFLGFKVVFQPTSNNRTRRHLLIDGPMIQSIGVEDKDLLTRSGAIVTVWPTWW